MNRVWALALLATGAASVRLLEPFVVPDGQVGYSLVRNHSQSALYKLALPPSTVPGHAYSSPPLLVDLHGTRHEIGYAYAALLHNETVDTFTTFLDSVFPSATDQALLLRFDDFLWERFYASQTPAAFLDEMAGMLAYHEDTKTTDGWTTDTVARHFMTLSNMPADAPNIIAGLEHDLEEGWPQWLKDAVNDVVKLLERLRPGCDAYGVWGSRTEGGLLFSSRNLDYNSDTGINRHKLTTVYHVQSADSDAPLPGGVYVTTGYAFGLGALAGMSQAGVTTSEMNLDNSQVTFQGVPFPLRLREVLERATDLESAMAVWNSTANTNSFNFVIGSAVDGKAVALETIRGFTAMFGANSGVERDATYNCTADPSCHKWTNATGPAVPIGAPLPEAVWRTNHGLHPRVLASQEPLFRNTVYRYELLHDLISGLSAAGQKINDTSALGLSATLGIKGPDFFSCDPPYHGDHVMSLAFAPGPRPPSSPGYLYVSWECGGSGAASSWRPAACCPYVKLDLARWL